MKRLIFTAVFLSLLFAIVPAFAAVSIDQPNLPEVIKAAEGGDRNAQFEVGMVYFNGYHAGIPRDRAKALEWFLKAAAQGHIEGQFNAGVMYLNGDGTAQNDVQAREWLLKSAEQGHAGAQLAIGMMYKTGRGGMQDYVKAAEWYRKSAEQGNAQAQDNLGVLYRDGNGVAQNYATAAEWFVKAAANGNNESRINLGVSYFYGQGVPKDEAKAAELFLQSAEQGNMAAQFNIGLFLENGVGVKANMAEAIEWYNKAAKQGHADAQKKMEQFASYIEKLNTFIELCRNGTPQDVEDAIKAGAEVNTKNSEGITGLIAAAAKNSNPEVIDTLIKNGADVGAKDKKSLTALMYALQFNSNPEVITALYKADASADVNETLIVGGESGTSLMLAASANSNPEVTTALIKAGADVNAKSKDGFTALMGAAARNSNPEVTIALINAGADVNAKHENGFTVLMGAASNNSNPEVTIALIKAGADINAKDKRGFTVLMEAAAYNSNLEVMIALIKAGADVNVGYTNGNGTTALMMFVVSDGNPAGVTALVEGGANVNAQDGNGETALIRAARMSENPEIITALLQNGADAKLKDNKGQIALDYAKNNISLENTDAFRELTARSADTDTTTGQSGTQGGTGFSLTIDTGQGTTSTGGGTTTGQTNAPILWEWGAPVPSDREWTILVYLDGDNDIERDSITDMKELEKGLAPDAKVDVIVLFDRAKGYDDSFGDWTETRVYHVKPSVRDNDFDSEMIANCGELNMGDPATLEAFIRAGTAKYPAPRTALVMWNHGSGWIAMANDEDAPGTTDGTDEITLAEFRDVLEHTSPLLPDNKFELVFFDMCLMGQVETAAACAPFAKYMLASAPLVPWVGMDYTNAIPLFKPGDATDKILPEMVKVGCAGYLRAPCKYSSLTAFDLSKTDAFLEAFKVMAAKLSERIPETWGDLTRTLFFSLNYVGRSDYERGQGSCSSIDLLDWLTRVKKSVKNPPMKEIASLEAAARALIIATEKGPYTPFCNGLSFYAPLRNANLKPEYAETDFNKKTGWMDVLAKLHEIQAKEGMEQPKVVSIEFGVPDFSNYVEGKPYSGADIKITPSDSVIPLSGKDEGGSWVKITFEGKNILWGYMGMGMSDTADSNGDYTMFIHSILMDENLDLQVGEKKREEAADYADAITPVFKDGRTELAYMFGGVTNKFSNGEKSVFITADFLDISDLKHFIVKGLYSDQQTSEVNVEVKVNTDFYSIEGITAIADNGTVSTISPRPEGVFRPLLNKRDKDGKASLVPGEEITWKDGLYIIMEPIPEGKFTKILAMAESIGGNGGQFISSPVAVKANQTVSSLINTTNQEGRNRVLGRYAMLGAVPRSDNGVPIIAPLGSSINIQIETSPSGNEGLVAIQRLFEEAELKTYINWEMEGLPYVSRYIYDEETKEFELIERDFALLVLDGNSYYWRMNDVTNYTLFMLIPFDNPILSQSKLEGAWDGEDGSSLVFEKGQASYFPPEANRRGISGNCSITGSVVEITPSGRGQPFKFSFCFNDNQEVMVVTFQDTYTAMLYNRRQPIIIHTQINLTGVWGTVINGQQAVMQVQLGIDQQTYQYQAWLNGMFFEAGVFQIQGNNMVGQTTGGQSYTIPFQLGLNGMSFSLTYPNGTVIYQRMQ